MEEQIMRKRCLSRAVWLPCLALTLSPLLVQAAPLVTSSGPFELVVLVNGERAPAYYHRGESYILGQKGARYTLRIHNRTGRRIEAVVTVDGLDALDGKAGSLGKRGYVVPAWGYTDIDGWRLSSSDVAAFRFSSVANSYAGQTGRTRDVGVIGAAIFKEYVYTPPPPPPPVWNPYPPYPYPYRDRYPSDESESRSEYNPGAQRKSEADSSLGTIGGGGSQSSAEAKPRASAPARSSAGDAVSRPMPPREERPGLATAFGERAYSPVQQTSFRRASSRPNAVLGGRYNDQSGLMALGVDLSYIGCCQDDPALRQNAKPFPASNPPYADPPRGWPY
jgi:hypothetical protein